MQVSIIIPVLNEEKNVELIAAEIDAYCKLPYEIIFVDDGSTDNTFLNIQLLSSKNNSIKCISFSRNFGHQNAIMAGLENASGVYIVVMDGDLQDPPSLIPEMLTKLHEGFDIVITRRDTIINSTFLKRTTRIVFYKFINAISDVKIEPNVADFKAFNRKVLKSILQFKERELFLRGMFSWMGYKTTEIKFEAPERKYGKTKYSFSKMLRLALKGTTSFSFKPLRVALMIGSLISLSAFLFAIYAFVSYFQGNTIPGWASTIIAVMFLGGTQLLAIGLLGEYIASLFTETKHRPLYLVDKKLNMD